MVGWISWVMAARAEPAGITLDEAVALSGSTPAVRASGAAREGAEARLDQAQSGRLPGVGVSGSVNVWNGPQVVSLVSPDAEIPEPFGSLFGEPLVVRDQVTATLTAHTAVPLTGQFVLDKRVDAARDGLVAADASVDSARIDARYQAADAWFVARQADRQLEIAGSQVASLEARVRVAGVAFEGGTVTRNDVLQADLALARAQQAVLQVRAMRDTARGRLGLAIGNPGEPMVPQGDNESPPRPVPDVEALVARAIDSRPDLVALRAQVQAASDSASAASLERIPQLSAVAAYIHTEGQGTFAQPNAAYVGANLEWSIWSWGAHDAAVQGARASADQTRAQLEGMEAGVRVEVRSRADALAAATAAWEVAQRSIGQAEESLRIEETVREAGSGTMSDLLDAEAALVEARSRSANALYDAKRAEVALERAVGADPWEGR